MGLPGSLPRVPPVSPASGRPSSSFIPGSLGGAPPRPSPPHRLRLSLCDAPPPCPCPTVMLHSAFHALGGTRPWAGDLPSQGLLPRLKNEGAVAPRPRGSARVSKSAPFSSRVDSGIILSPINLLCKRLRVCHSARPRPQDKAQLGAWDPDPHRSSDGLYWGNTCGPRHRTPSALPLFGGQGTV